MQTSELFNNEINGHYWKIGVETILSVLFSPFFSVFISEIEFSDLRVVPSYFVVFWFFFFLFYSSLLFQRCPVLFRLALKALTAFCVCVEAWGEGNGGGRLCCFHSLPCTLSIRVQNQLSSLLCWAEAVGPVRRHLPVLRRTWEACLTAIQNHIAGLQLVAISCSGLSYLIM